MKKILFIIAITLFGNTYTNNESFVRAIELNAKNWGQQHLLNLTQEECTAVANMLRLSYQLGKYDLITHKLYTSCQSLFFGVDHQLDSNRSYTTELENLTTSITQLKLYNSQKSKIRCIWDASTNYLEQLSNRNEQLNNAIKQLQKEAQELIHAYVARKEFILEQITAQAAEKMEHLSKQLHCTASLYNSMFEDPLFTERPDLQKTKKTILLDFAHRTACNCKQTNIEAIQEMQNVEKLLFKVASVSTNIYKAYYNELIKQANRTLFIMFDENGIISKEEQNIKLDPL